MAVSPSTGSETTPRALCVFCGSRVGNDPIFAEAARELGTTLAREGITLVYGGGRVGLMGVVSEAVKAAGGEVVGVIPDFLVRREVANTAVDRMVVTHSMHERKQRMFDLSDGFVVLPGGIGTLDETIEILTWRQLQQHSKPLVLVNIGDYWRPLLGLFDALIRDGFAGEVGRSFFLVVDSVGEVLPALRRVPVPPRGSSAGL